MKRMIKASSNIQSIRAKMTSADEYAAEYAGQKLDEGYSLDEAVRYGVRVANEGNAEPEYEGEDFYLEEADPNIVTEYLKARYSSATARSKYPKIKSSTSIKASLAPFNYKKYYEKAENDVMFDGNVGEDLDDVYELFEDEYGLEIIDFLQAKDKYIDQLMDNGVEFVVLAKEPGGKPQIYTWIDDRVFDASDDARRGLGLDY